MPSCLVLISFKFRRQICFVWLRYDHCLASSLTNYYKGQFWQTWFIASWFYLPSTSAMQSPLVMNSIKDLDTILGDLIFDGWHNLIRWQHNLNFWLDNIWGRPEEGFVCMLAVELLGQLSSEPQPLLVHQTESWKDNDKSVHSTDLFFYKSQNGNFLQIPVLSPSLRMISSISILRWKASGLINAKVPWKWKPIKI